jgi:UDP-3-O-[3-hydroxymyristoyl] N-acetylglucosamine deacetylase/3-hydroxyacyl-[acyl-carrier-protein] dehydratase
LKRNQRTIKNPIEISGVGLHTGQEVHLKIKPAAPDTGVVFVRTDLSDQPQIPATIDYLTRNERRTSLRNDGGEVHTTEHLFAALMGLKIDNLEVELDGTEIPGLDGSSAPYVNALMEAGVVDQKVARKHFDLDNPLIVEGKGRTLSAFPAKDGGLHLCYTLDYQGNSVGSQFFEFQLEEEFFTREIAPARTFCLETEVDELRNSGLGKGASYENTLVISESGVIENELRFKNEYVRHKLLDLVGDLFLVNADVSANIHALKTGHEDNTQLVRLILDEIQLRETKGILSRDTGLDIKEIFDLLPHRYPFLLIDRVIEIEGYRRAVGIKNVSINEPFFQGHWPGQPIMPGVLILEAMAQLSGVLLLRRLENTGKLAVLWSIDKVKLRRSVIPGDQLRIEIEATKVRDKIGQVNAKAKVNQLLAAEAILTFTLVDAT